LQCKPISNLKLTDMQLWIKWEGLTKGGNGMILLKAWSHHTKISIRSKKRLQERNCLISYLNSVTVAGGALRALIPEAS
jgi:hypothetical protein